MLEYSTLGSETMNITIGKLQITEYCKENAEHIKFKKELLDDGLMSYYFPNINETNFLNPSVIDNGNIRINNYYIVKDNEKLIGWLYIGGFEREMVLNCGIHPYHRRKGYLTLLLEESRDYFCENKIVDSIEVMIRNNNTGALKAIKKAKYKHLGKIGNYHIYNLESK